MTLETRTRLRNAAAPLAALVYPWLVALGPALHPALILLALAVPALAFHLAWRRIDPARFPAARRIAFLAIGAPALFSMAGGWLDGQRLLPFKGTGFWVMLWVGLAAWAWAESAKVQPPELAEPRRLPAWRTAHGVCALAILLFAVAHLANHLAGLNGGAAHWAMMQALRLVYRHPVVETALLACVTFQIGSGAFLAWHATLRRAGLVPSLQVAAGVYLLCFFGSHLSAVFRTRLLRGVDTDWRWLTSSSLLADPWSARLLPYYWLGVIALGIHLAAGLRFVLLAHGVRASRAGTAFAAVCAGACLVSTLVMAGLVVGAEQPAPPPSSGAARHPGASGSGTCFGLDGLAV